MTIAQNAFSGREGTSTPSLGITRSHATPRVLQVIEVPIAASEVPRDAALQIQFTDGHGDRFALGIDWVAIRIGIRVDLREIPR